MGKKHASQYANFGWLPNLYSEDIHRVNMQQVVVPYK